MKQKAFWLMSLILVVGALIVHLYAMRAAANHAVSIDRAYRMSEPIESELLAETRTESRKIGRLVGFGWLSAGTGALCLLVAYRREEPAPLLSTLLLLGLYVLLQFGAV